MKRLLVVVCPLVLTASCAPRYDMFLSWTIDGQDASSACEAFSKPSIEVHAEQRETEDGAILDEHFDLDCKAGAGSIAVASFSDVALDLMSGKAVWGYTTSESTAAGTDDEYVGKTAADPLAFDIRVTKSRLQARLTVVGESCGDAGVASFTVSLSKVLSPLNEEPVDGQQEVGVDCEDGEAYYEFAPADVGSMYKIAATAVLDLATDGTGEAVTASGPLTEFTVDLTPTE